MVFKDPAGSMLAQRELAKREKEVLYALQIKNHIKNTASGEPAKMEQPVGQVPQYKVFKPQEMHCLKKLLEQEYDPYYTHNNPYGVPLYVHNYHMQKMNEVLAVGIPNFLKKQAVLKAMAEVMDKDDGMTAIKDPSYKIDIEGVDAEGVDFSEDIMLATSDSDIHYDFEYKNYK